MNVWGITHRGVVREENQDAFAVQSLSEHEALAVVCDGMGGARAGNVASALTVDIFLDGLLQDLREGELPPAQALERSAEQAREQLVRVEQAVAGLPGELSAGMSETIRREAATLREQQEEQARQIAYLTTRFNDADAATKERWRLVKIALLVLSGLWTGLGWFMTKFGPAIFNALGFGNPGAGR